VLDGLGTEKLEDTLTALFPTARVARLDRDVAGGRNTEKILDRMRRREVDILVGTQMVTKGHDLPHVTLVGVINADAALSIPDFRAAERAFQQFVQVAGRAGRGDIAGRVLIQTYNPEHPALVFAKAHDVEGFLAAELSERRILNYPPFSRLALLRTDALEEKDALEAAETLAQACLRANTPGVAVLGPSAAPLARLRNRYRFRVMLRANSRAALRTTLEAIRPVLAALPRTVRAQLDVDPVQLM
jgi:primosomal protein N' (replication factor Y) (superfamily II helicase)